MTLRVPWVALLVAIAVATWPAAVRAAEVADPGGGFRVNVEMVGARVCVVLPKGPSDAACDGLDVEAMRAAVGDAKEPPFGFVLVRFDDRTLMVTLLKLDVRTVSAESIQRTTDGAEDGMRAAAQGLPLRVHGDEPTARYDLLEVNGANVARYAIDLDVPPTHPKYPMSRTLSYLVAARDLTYNVSVTGDLGHADDVRALGDAIMKTLRVPPYKNADFGRTRDYARGRLMGSLLGTLIGVAGMVGLLILLWRHRNKKKPA
jgi:hypothetical protein